jgi:hypothetical protein
MSVFSSYVKKIMDNNKDIFGGSPETVVNEIGKEASKAIEKIPPPVLESSEVDPDANLDAYQQDRKGKKGRKYANLAPASGASILTG